MCVLVADLEIIVAERDPDALAAPADVDDLALERQPRKERGAGFRRQFGLQLRAEDEGAGGNFQFGHCMSSRLQDLLSPSGYSGGGGPARGAFAVLRRKVLPIASRSALRDRKYSVGAAIGISSPGGARL